MASGRLSIRWPVPKQSRNAVVGACVCRTRTTPSYISTPMTVRGDCHVDLSLDLFFSASCDLSVGAKGRVVGATREVTVTL